MCPLQCEGMQEFLQCVNTGIRIQEETERVRDAMNRITGFQMGDVPNEIKEVCSCANWVDKILYRQRLINQDFSNHKNSRFSLITACMNLFLQLVQPHTHLDLLAPMTGVEVDRARVLMLEGSLKFRDGLTSAKVSCYCIVTHVI